MSSNSIALPLSLYTELSRVVQAEGRKAFAQRAGVSVSVVERAMAFGRISPMARKLILAALEAKPSPKDLPAA